MGRPDEAERTETTASGERPVAPGAAPNSPPTVPAPIATNSWARRTILARAQEIGLDPDLARQVGSVALWYYNRIVLRSSRKDSIDRELPHSTNRYLVPISLALACQFKQHPVELDRLLRLSGTPTEKTAETAHKLLTRYAEMLTPRAGSNAAPRPGRGVPPARTGGGPKPGPHPEFQLKAADRSRASAPGGPRPSAGRPTIPRSPSRPPTALAVPPSPEILQLRRVFGTLHPARPGDKPPPKPRQQNTNAWARRRISDLCRSQGIPDHVKRRSLEFYERIVDFHSRKGGVPAGKRLQLSPRLNWSLVYTTIYLGCRFEEYPKDLRDILGRTPHEGSLREMYGLYRFYKRELRLAIKLVDVKTFILSWLDGFELSELMREKAATSEQEWVKNRAIAIANRARGDQALRNSSTKLIAAGAFTTALAERDPPGNRYAFYKAVAAFLHMSEETIRLIVARIAEIL